MTQPTKRAPGRPKAQPRVEAVETVSAPTKKAAPIRRREEKSKNCVYEVVSGGGIVWMLPQSGITVFDKSKGEVRELRYCPNENSVWTDEQGAKALKKSVVFRDGMLFVREDQPNLKSFLDLHPHNVANGGSKFKLVDKTVDAEAELEKEFLVTDAITRVRDTDINDLLAVAIYFKINISSPVSEIRRNLLNIAKSNPSQFMEAFDSPSVMARAIIKQSIDYQILKATPDAVKWFDSNSRIVSVPSGQDPVDIMVRFCMTEKGASVLSDLEERLEKLS
jgi:hypothetical protein